MTKASSRPRTNSPRCLGGASSLRQPNSGAGYLWSEQNAEVANGETNSYVTATGTTGNFSSMAAGQTDSTWDAGVRAVFDLSVDDNNSLADAVDAVVNYLPGYEGNVAKLSTGTTFNNQVYTGQRTKLLADGIGSNIANLKRIEFEIKLSTIFLGYASNRSDPTVEGNTNLHDYSFQRNGDNDLISINRFSMQTQPTGGFYYGGKIEATCETHPAFATSNSRNHTVGREATKRRVMLH